MDQLIIRALTGDPLRQKVLSVDDLEQVLAQVARAGFDPTTTTRVAARGIGILYRGPVIRAGDRLSPAEAHYIRHVLFAQEWPVGTSFADYLASLTATVLAPASGVFASTYQGVPQLGVLGRSGPARGPAGSGWIL